MTQTVFDFAGKRVLVTGGAAGIGLAVGTEFARAGAKVVLLDRNKQGLDQAVQSVNAAVGTARVSGVVCDLADTDEIARGAREATEKLEGIDILVNNAGVGAARPFLDLSAAELDLNLDINLRATILLTRELIRGMIETGNASVVNISSQAAKVKSPEASHYAASKAGVLGFTMSLAAEVAPAVRVNAICPGMVMTGMMANNIRLTMEKKGITHEQSLAEWSAGIPMGRMQQPVDIARGVMFLASDAASEITGIALNISGGQTMH